MGIFEIISAIVLILACVFIVIVVLMKDTKTQMSQTISGTSADSFYQKNAGRTKEAMLNKATIVSAIIFFVLALAVNIINVYFGGSGKTESSSTVSSSVVSQITESDSNTSDEVSSEVSDDSAADSTAPDESEAGSTDAESTASAESEVSSTEAE